MLRDLGILAGLREALQGEEKRTGKAEQNGVHNPPHRDVSYCGSRTLLTLRMAYVRVRIKTTSEISGGASAMAMPVESKSLLAACRV